MLCTNPSCNQCLDKSVVILLCSFKPVPNQPPKHPANLLIGKCQLILWFFIICHFVDLLVLYHLQITAGKQKAPNRLRIVIKLVIHDLFINRTPDMFPIQQQAKQFFYILVPLPKQLPHKAVTACICPVSRLARIGAANVR